MSYQKNLDELGNTIEAIIDRAVSSQDFQQLNQTIRQALNTAVDTGGDAVRRAMDEAAKKKAARNRIVEERSDAPRYVPPYRTREQSRNRYQPNVNVYSSTLGSSRKPQQQGPKLPALYQNPSGKLAGGICKTVGGGVLTLFGSGGLISSSIVALVTSLGSVFSVLGTISLLGLGGGIWLLTNGIRSIKKVGRYEKYLKALGNKTYCELNRLAQAVGKSPKFVRKELKGMIDDGLFLEGHLDEEETGLITSNDSYVHYLETKQKQAVKKQEEVLETVRAQKEADTKKVSAQAQEVLDRGNEFIRQLRRCNEAIPGQEISEKISRMETLVGNIFDRVESHPEVVPELKKLMDYYLPMTVKLLNAYADMDAQSVQGENIQSSKREIEATLDTLNTAFEKLLDSIFKTTALDVSSDITVLQTLLAQEGLTEDDFSKLRKNNEKT